METMTKTPAKTLSRIKCRPIGYIVGMKEYLTVTDQRLIDFLDESEEGYERRRVERLRSKNLLLIRQGIDEGTAYDLGWHDGYRSAMLGERIGGPVMAGMLYGCSLFDEDDDESDE